MKQKSCIFSILALMSVIFATGCGPSVLERVNSSIDKSCGTDGKCQVTLAEHTEFEWDRVFYFGNALEAHQINEILGQDISFRRDYFGFSHKLVFMKGDKIVHSEKIPAGIEDFARWELVFDVDPLKKYGVFPKSAVFSVTRMENTSEKAFRLECSNC